MRSSLPGKARAVVWRRYAACASRSSSQRTKGQLPGDLNSAVTRSMGLRMPVQVVAVFKMAGWQ